MKIRQFQGRNMRTVMAQIHAELGEEAVILSSSTLPDGSVEVTAAVDDVPGQPSAVPLSGMNAGPSAAEARQIERMSEELARLRALVEQQLSGLAWGQTQQKMPGRALLLRRLLAMGLGWELAQSLLEALPEEVEQSEEAAWPHLLALLGERLHVTEEDILKSGGIVALVGPTGVGKTTTIAKLAGRFVMRHGAGQLALITTDCYKIGAQAQLQTFAEMMGVPVHVAQTRNELETLLIGLRDRKLILIDTAGMSQKDIRITQQLTAGYSGLVPLKNYLVMSAASPLKVMREVYQAFSRMGLKGLILTKLDEAVQLGGALTLMAETQLPLAWLSEGQRVPEDIERVDVDHLIDRAMVMLDQNGQAAMESAMQLGVGKEFFDAQ